MQSDGKTHKNPSEIESQLQAVIASNHSDSFYLGVVIPRKGRVMLFKSESKYHRLTLEVKKPYTVKLYEETAPAVPVLEKSFLFKVNARKFAKDTAIKWSHDSMISHDWHLVNRDGLVIDGSSTAKRVEVSFVEVPLINR